MKQNRLYQLILVLVVPVIAIKDDGSIKDRPNQRRSIIHFSNNEGSEKKC